MERVVEVLPDAVLEGLLADLVRLDEHRASASAPSLSLNDRIAAHAAATRRGEFLGEYEMRNHHGQREPGQTHAWIAATWDLFDLARAAAPEESGAALRALTALVAEVDERAEELVVFEDANARDQFGLSLDQD